MAELVTTLTADGNSTAFTVHNNNNGAETRQNVAVFGDFGSGTATVQISYDGGTTYFAVTDSIGDVTFTANGAVDVRAAAAPNNTANQTKLRVNLASSTDPDLNIIIRDVR